MGANKNKKKNSSNRNGPKKTRTPDTNPFELKINRQKHVVLGRKIAKHDKGMPGHARSRSLTKRKETLLVEYKKLGRGNKMIDRRIGENDPTMSFDEKMAKRFAFERQNEKSSSDLLGDDEEEVGAGSEDELTHFGQSLSELENFKDPVVSDDDDEDSDSGRISTKVVGEEHFGGFLTKRQPNDDPSNDEKPKSWKERMEEIISKSKKAKFERQTEKEKMMSATKDLDADWKELQMLVSALKKNRETEGEAAKTTTTSQNKDAEEYDVVVKQLQFERKAQPTDRLKTEEELAKEEKEKLDKLEADRISRMNGVDIQSGSKYVSADDLDDGFALGKPDVINISDSEDEDDGNAGGNEESSDADSEQEEDDLDDVEPDSEEPDSEDSSDDVAVTQPATKRVRFAASVDVSCYTDQPQKPAAKLSVEEMEAAKNELPYTFTAPESYEDLLELFAGHTDEQCLVIIDRLRKCHHPSLAEGNKAKLENLLVLLLGYFGEVGQRSVIPFELIDGLTRHLFDLTQMSPGHAGQAMADIVHAKYEQFNCDRDENNGRAVYPGLDMLLYLKLVSVLFPTSDRRHPVVTPAMLLISHLLTQCPVNSTRDVAYCLFLCSLCADYVCLSHRLFPEVINSLCGLLFLAAYKVQGKVIPVVPPFKTYGKNRDLLKIDTDCSCTKVEVLSVKRVFAGSDVDYLKSTEFKVHSVMHILQLVNVFANYYSSLPAFRQIFSSIRHYIGLLPLAKYPEQFKSLFAELSAKFDAKMKLSRVIRQAVKPQPLKLHEPKITENFDGRKKRNTGNKEQNEKQRLVYKHKRELKGAIREIRKDSQFIARHKLQEQISKDGERKRKVKELMGQLAQQEGDFKKLKKAHKTDAA